MQALITGSNGFVGPFLARELASRGYQVAGIDLEARELPYLSTLKAEILNPVSLRSIFELVKPDVVFHLAAQSSVKISLLAPKETMQINVEGTRNVFEAAGRARILVIGSSEVYGNPEKSPVREDAALQPLNPYAESRVRQEELVREYVKLGKNIVSTRSFSHTGPGQSDVFVCSDFAHQIAMVEKGKKERVQTGNLYTIRDFSDVRDIVQAYVLLAEKGKVGEIYNVCSGKGVLLKEIMRLLQSFSNSKILVEESKDKIREKDILACVGDNSKLKAQTGWQPRLPLRQTLQDLLEYWRTKV